MLTALLFWLGALIIVEVLGSLARAFEARTTEPDAKRGARYFKSLMGILEMILIILLVASLVGIGASYYFAAL